jgi:hypothetical protein
VFIISVHVPLDPSYTRLLQFYGSFLFLLPFLHTVDIRLQLLQNTSNLILLTLNQVSFVKWKFTAYLYSQYQWYFAQIYSEDLQENVFRPHYGPDVGFSKTSRPGWGPHRLFFNGFWRSLRGEQRPKSQVSHSPPSSTEVNTWVEPYIYCPCVSSCNGHSRAIHLLSMCVFMQWTQYSHTFTVHVCLHVVDTVEPYIYYPRVSSCCGHSRAIHLLSTCVFMQWTQPSHTFTVHVCLHAMDTVEPYIYRPCVSSCSGHSRAIHLLSICVFMQWTQ